MSPMSVQSALTRMYTGDSQRTGVAKLAVVDGEAGLWMVVGQRPLAAGARRAEESHLSVGKSRSEGLSLGVAMAVLDAGGVLLSSDGGHLGVVGVGGGGRWKMRGEWRRKRAMGGSWLVLGDGFL